MAIKDDCGIGEKNAMNILGPSDGVNSVIRHLKITETGRQNVVSFCEVGESWLFARALKEQLFQVMRSFRVREEASGTWTFDSN